jgi:hypothetical protein
VVVMTVDEGSYTSASCCSFRSRILATKTESFSPLDGVRLAWRYMRAVGPNAPKTEAVHRASVLTISDTSQSTGQYPFEGEPHPIGKSSFSRVLLVSIVIAPEGTATWYHPSFPRLC